jgi:outer membrane protein assembly factor BamB
MAVHVSSFVPHALVVVFANGVEVGRATPFFGFADIPLSRPLALGEAITAKETFERGTSDASDPVPVEELPKMTTPVLAPVVYSCGVGVAVDNLVASTHVEILDETAPPGKAIIGEGETTGPWTAIAVPRLHEPSVLRAVQIGCRHDPSVNASAASEARGVTRSPRPPPAPMAATATISGLDAATVHGLLLGAKVEVSAGADVLSTGYWATGPDAWFQVTRPVPAGPLKVTQTLCATSPPASLIAPSVPGPPRLRWPICNEARTVSVDDTDVNALVLVYRRTAAAPTPVSIGAAGGMLGTLKMGLGPGVRLAAGDVLYATQEAGSNESAHSNEITIGCAGGVNVVTQHNDSFRTGAYLTETVLSPASIGQFGMRQRFDVEVAGNVISQPLYVRDLQLDGWRGNVLFVSTDRNYVYALDAQTGAVKWERKILDPYRILRVGTSSTPVIDLDAGRIYVLFKTGKAPEADDDFENDAVDVAFWLVALRLRDGAVDAPQTRIAASVLKADGSQLAFVAKNQTGHPALLLDRGSLFLGFGARATEEASPAYFPLYQGWVLRYRAADLALEAAFNTAPNRDVRANVLGDWVVAAGSGIWQGGGGLAADPDGNVYFLTGNGRSDWSRAAYGDSFLKLTVQGGWLVPTAYAPHDPPDLSDRMEAGDADLGSGGALVLPGRDAVIGGGKTGYMYLLARSTMGHRQQLTAATAQYAADSTPRSRWQDWNTGPHLHGSPTFWPGPERLYVWGEKDFPRVFAFNPHTQMFSPNPVAVGIIKADRQIMPGGMMSLSANGGDSKSGVVWANLPVPCQTLKGEAPAQAGLFALDAQTLQEVWSNRFGTMPHWAPPTIADGAVFVTTWTDGHVIAFELATPANGGHRLDWTPYKPDQACQGCRACHTDQQREELSRRYPLDKLYLNEATVPAQAARAARAVSPPGEGRASLVLEGNGVQVYAATVPRGSAGARVAGPPVWTLRETTADLAEVGPDGIVKPQGARVRLSAGPVWTAGDGSAVAGQIEKSAEAPGKVSAPWALYKVVRHDGHGVLGEQSYVQCLYTHAGQAPKAAPAKAGDVARVPYVAQYWFYK